MYSKKMGIKRRTIYQGLFKACDDLLPGEGEAFIYETKEEAQAARTALYNYLKISGFGINRKIQKIGNDPSKFWLQNTLDASEIIKSASDMETLKSTLKTYDSEGRIVIVDFLRDSKMLSVDQAMRLNTFSQGITGSHSEPGVPVEKTTTKKKRLSRSDRRVKAAIKETEERFPTVDIPKENPVLDPFA